MVWPAQQTIGYHSQALNILRLLMLRLSEGIFSYQRHKFLPKQQEQKKERCVNQKNNKNISVHSSFVSNF